MPAFTRRQYNGAAAATTITAGINTSDTTCSLTATTGWPSSAGVPFYVVIDPGTSAEEKCSATISGSTLTLTRAQDDTSASSHSAGAAIYPVFTANDADEANELVSKLTTKGDLLVTTGSALNRLAVGTNAHLLTADSASTNGVKWALSPETDLVTTKGDILVGTAADTLARQGVGANGSVLMADSAQTNGIAWSTAQTSNRNKIINGDFKIWQRGTSYTVAVGNYGAADRYIYWHNGSTNGTNTVSRQTFTPGAAPVAGYESEFFQRTTTTTLGTGQTVIDTWQYIEDVRTLAGQAVTFSFWAKTSGTFTVTGLLNQNFGSGGSAAVDTTVISSATSGSWTRYTGTVTLPSISGKTVGSNSALHLIIRFISPTAGATFDLWGVQVEAGSVATPFETEDFGTTLEKCQRYYQKSWAYATAPATATVVTGLQFSSFVTNATNGFCLGQITFVKPFRANPTVTIYSYASAASGKVSDATGTDLAAGSGTAQFISEKSANVYNASGGTITPGTGGFIWHFVASSEL